METSLQEFFDTLDSLYEKGDPKAVENFLLKQAIINTGCGRAYSEAEVIIYNELGSFYRGIGKLDKSIASYMESKAIVEAHIGVKTFEYATIINNLAGTYRLKGEYETAISLFKEALGVYEETVSRESYYYSSALNNLSLVYRDLNDLDHAETYLRKAMAIIKGKQGMEEEYAIAHANLGAIYIARKDYDEAEKQLKRSLAIYTSLPGGYNPIHFAALYNSLGILKAAQLKFDESIKDLDYSRKLVLSINGKSLEYADACLSIARIYKVQEKLEDAKRELLEAKAALEALGIKDGRQYEEIIKELEELPQ